MSETVAETVIDTAAVKRDAGGRGCVAVVAVSIDLGAGRRGVDMGPSALRIAGLGKTLESLGYTVREGGTVYAEGPETTTLGETRLRFRDEILEVAVESHDLVRKALAQGCFPLILGGDHSLSIGTAAAVAGHYRDLGKDIGLIWVDAHTDMNTPETTPSGNIHGMSLAVLTGHGPKELVEVGGHVPAVRPENVCIIGARDIDEEEKEVVREAGVRVFTMSEIDEKGMPRCMDEAIERATDGTAGFHLSYDVDGLDPMVAPGVGTPVAGGFTYREGHLVVEKAHRSGKMLGLEIVEVNPVLDAGNRTAQMAVGLVASALGKTIL